MLQVQSAKQTLLPSATPMVALPRPGQVKSLCFFWKGLRALHVPARFNLCQRSTLTDS